MTTGAYLPLIGNDNIVSVLDTSAVEMVQGTINGTVANGRKGTQKTQLLIALNGSATTAVPATTAAALCSMVVKCPPGFATPASNGLDGYDYSKLLPDIRASVVCSAFTHTAGAFPVDITALLTAIATAPANVPSIEGRVTAVGAPDEDNPNGTLTISFAGAMTTAAVANALLLATVDFGASVAN